MPSLTTLYRAIVMVAAGVIVVKGWQLCGPTTEQVKSMAVRAVELANLAWDSVQPAPPAPSSTDPRLATAPPVAEPAAASLVEPAPLFPPGPGEAKSMEEHELTGDALETRAAAVAAAGSLPDAVADRLPPLYSRLENLGVSEPQLAPWGSSGQMYRFCCRASWVGTPSFTRHFEAVAEEPVAAVEQVVAKVEDSRAAQRPGERLQ